MDKNAELVKGITAIRSLINEMLTLGEDALDFVKEKNLWDEFMAFHAKKHVERVGKEKRNE